MRLTLAPQRGYRICSKRVTGDYGVEAVITPEEVTHMIEQAREFLQEARRYFLP